MTLNIERISAEVVPLPCKHRVCISDSRGTRVRAMEFFRSRRARLGLSQAALAERCHCHVTTISQIERGRIQPSLLLFASLSRELKVSPSRLLPQLLLLKNSAPPRAKASVTELLKERERRERRN